MCDDDQRSGPTERADGLHHLSLGIHVERARHFVKHQHVWIVVQRARDAEALTLARKGGVAWETILAVLGSSVAASPLVAYKLDPLRRRDFAPAFSIAQMLKDMSLAVAAGEAAGVAMPVAALVRDLYAEQDGTDLRDLDFFAALLAAERRAGLGEPA